ncbi:MAG TPA: 3-dehydroquinate synthase [Fimbriimonadaceae bacterium]|nr:3-dehydroquinate synthase [Fimbriimonadaceae bacterium]
MTVAHRLGTYEVAFLEPAEAERKLPGDALIVTDENVWAAWGKTFGKGRRVLVLPSGESTKSLSHFERCLKWLAEEGADRGATLVALGGGVIGDLAGFVASTYMRGIRYIQVPTTLVAQVDSSVGGKVAVDLPEGKNLVGAFYPPEEVLICPEVLLTLPWREFANGMAEVWKYGFILDADLVRALRHLRLTPQSAMLESVIRRCIQLKIEVVEQDESDTSGLRAVLNFGHTVGHALEKVLKYESLLHGEAVAIGMVAESKLGERLGVTARGTTEDITACLQLDGLPVTHDSLGLAETVGAMYADKKAEGGQLAFSLLTRIGECKLVKDVPRADVEAVMQAL